MAHPAHLDARQNIVLPFTDVSGTACVTSRCSPVLNSAVALVVALPNSALADPPKALPANADALEKQWQPAYDYDTDGCYSS